MADWFRWWHGSVTDTKFLWVARKSKQRLGDVLATWAAILEEASQADDRGSIAGFDAESFDCLLDADDGASEAILSAMEAKGLLSDGRLVGWDRRQPIREDQGNPQTGAMTGAERKRKQRENERHASSESHEPSRDVTTSHEPSRDVTTEESRGEESKPTTTITAREAGEPFPMGLDWEPSAHFPTLAHQAGVSVAEKQEFSESLAEFRSYWLTRSDMARTQHEWDHALLTSLKAGKARRQQGPPAKAGKTSRHTNFDQIDYREGISPDGRF